MECRDAQFYLRLRRHAIDELGPDASAALNGHLTGCPLCAADARGAASFDRAMGSAMRAVPLPGGLHERLVRHVATKQGAILRHKAYLRSRLAPHDPDGNGPLHERAAPGPKKVTDAMP